MSIVTKEPAVAEESWQVLEKRRLVSELERLDATALETVREAAEAGARARSKHASVLQERSNILAELAKLKGEHPELFV